ncbi:MAG: orotidine 5'-phosphate decarboxylase / HUMPS family protein, partial [Myxococcota bacterium]
GKLFARVLRQAGISVGILFPQAGPETLRAWVEALREEDLGVMVGGWMSHPHYVQSDGGFLSDDGVQEIYKASARLGVCDYVMPGNQPEVIEALRGLLLAQGITPRLYMPGFVTQGGDVQEAAAVSGNFWHAIVGRALVQAEDPVLVLDHLWAQMQAAIGKV